MDKKNKINSNEKKKNCCSSRFWGNWKWELGEENGEEEQTEEESEVDEVIPRNPPPPPKKKKSKKKIVKKWNKRTTKKQVEIIDYINNETVINYFVLFDDKLWVVAF